MENENYLEFNHFKVKSIVYDVKFDTDSIILIRPKYSFTIAFGVTLIFTCTYFVILTFDNDIASNKFFYILTIPLIIKFLFELKAFVRKLEYRIDKNRKCIFKNGKIFKAFDQIKSLQLSNIRDEDDNSLSFNLEIVFRNGIIFEIGETEDIRLYELGHKIS